MRINHAPWLLLFGVILLYGCNFPARGTVLPQPSATVPPPTETPIPIAALVGGEPILLMDYEEEVRRFEQAQALLGIDLATFPDYKERILQGMIEQKLLALGAMNEGAVIEATALEMEIQHLEDEIGDSESLENWLARNEYSRESFQRSLENEMLARQMITMITDQLSELVDQVHARHIVVASIEEANWLLSQIEAGVPFEELARKYSLDTSTQPMGGDLGWFPENYLLIPEVSEVAFSTAPGSISEVFESRLGFHILETLAREDRALSFDALVSFRESAVQAWLEVQNDNVEVQILITP